MRHPAKAISCPKAVAANDTCEWYQEDVLGELYPRKTDQKSKENTYGIPDPKTKVGTTPPFNDPTYSSGTRNVCTDNDGLIMGIPGKFGMDSSCRFLENPYKDFWD